MNPLVTSRWLWDELRESLPGDRGRILCPALVDDRRTSPVMPSRFHSTERPCSATYQDHWIRQTCMHSRCDQFETLQTQTPRAFAAKRGSEQMSTFVTRYSRRSVRRKHCQTRSTGSDPRNNCLYFVLRSNTPRSRGVSFLAVTLKVDLAGFPYFLLKRLASLVVRKLSEDTSSESPSPFQKNANT